MNLATLPQGFEQASVDILLLDIRKFTFQRHIRSSYEPILLIKNCNIRGWSGGSKSSFKPSPEGFFFVLVILNFFYSELCFTGKYLYDNFYTHKFLFCAQHWNILATNEVVTRKLLYLFLKLFEKNNFDSQFKYVNSIHIFK